MMGVGVLHCHFCVATGTKDSEGVQLQEGVGGRGHCQVCVVVREWEGDVPYDILPPFLNERKDGNGEGEEKPAVDVEPSAILAGTPHKRVFVTCTSQEYAS